MAIKSDKTVLILAIPESIENGEGLSPMAEENECDIDEADEGSTKDENEEENKEMLNRLDGVVSKIFAAW